MPRGTRSDPEAEAQWYREGYPGLDDDANSWDNLRFYRNEIPLRSKLHESAYISDAISKTVITRTIIKLVKLRGPRHT